MDLRPFVEDVREQLLTAAANSSEESLAVAERMTANIDSAVRLVLLEALSAAADEITIDLAPGSVEVRLRGRDPEFAVSAPATPTNHAPTPAAPSSSSEPYDGSTARITLRLPEPLKQRIEESAGREALSVNAWLVRTIANAADESARPAHSTPSSGQTFTGWVR